MLADSIRYLRADISSPLSNAREINREGSEEIVDDYVFQKTSSHHAYSHSNCSNRDPR